jgi:pimeloyl-ACP methyl ester carboxylesterase
MTTKTAFMIPGAFAGAWCWQNWKVLLESQGWQVSTPELMHHDRPANIEQLIGTGLNDYTDALAAEIDRLDEPPIIFGHSMGGLLAQKLAARGLAKALVLLTPESPWGVLPSSPNEIAAAQGIMSLGPFWTQALYSDFDIACSNSLTHIPAEQQRHVFDQFVPESGQALYECMFWMYDQGRTSYINPIDIDCPILCVAADEDKVIDPETVRKTADRYPDLATYARAEGFGHMLLIEPDWRQIADLALDWLADVDGVGK